MAQPLKTNGLRELASIRRRVRRQWLLERIYKSDHDFLMDRINEMEAHIVAMKETLDNGEEVG
jgi:hypothetical protein